MTNSFIHPAVRASITDSHIIFERTLIMDQKPTPEPEISPMAAAVMLLVLGALSAFMIYLKLGDDTPSCYDVRVAASVAAYNAGARAEEQGRSQAEAREEARQAGCAAIPDNAPEGCFEQEPDCGF
jgi:hypothetical protein